MKRYEDLWENDHKSLFESCISFIAVNITFCMKCGEQVFDVIRCNTCNQHFCGECDLEKHFNLPFHIRLQLCGLETIFLKPTQFIDDGKKVERSMSSVNELRFASQILIIVTFLETEVPVPCFIPAQCPCCGLFNMLKRVGGSKPMKVVTLEGTLFVKPLTIFF